MTRLPPSGLRPLGVAEWCQHLATDIQASLLRHDTDHPVFHGSWDWHSSVHGHWALLSVSRHTEDHALAAWVTRRLRSPAMAQELRQLHANPDFELPYGRAWLLRTLIELGHLTGEPLLQQAGMAVARGVRTWLSQRKLSPDVAEYINPSWPLLQYHAWSQHVADAPAQAWCRTQVLEAFLSPCQLGADHTTQEFFSRWSLQCLLIAEVLGAPALADWIGAQRLSATDIAPVAVCEAVHHLGMNASRSWGFAMAWRATGEPRWEAAYWANLRASLALHETWRADHYAYGHWVPQFSVYGLLIDSLHPAPSRPPARQKR